MEMLYQKYVILITQQILSFIQNQPLQLIKIKKVLRQ